MLAKLRQSWLTLLLVIMLVVAGVQFAGHSVRTEATDPELALYVAMGGSLDDVCLTDGGEHNHADCPFCRETDVFVLAKNPSLEADTGRIFATAYQPAASLQTPQTIQLRPHARAPPAA